MQHQQYKAPIHKHKILLVPVVPKLLALTHLGLQVLHT